VVRVGFVSLGCPKNLVDSEIMMGHVSRAGYVLTPRPEDADVLVVNTCSFIDAAREESVDTILEMSRFKSAGSCRRLVVAGCLVQRSRQELAKALPEVDAFIGLDELDRIVEAVRPSVERESWRSGGAPGRSTALHGAASPRHLSGPAWSAYLKISEGCDNPCSFCAIPSFRGAYRSRRLGDVREEAERLAAGGVRELNLIAQDSTAYGRDLGFPDGPERLLRSLQEIEALRWIRLFYLYPNRVTPSLIRALADCDRVVKYVDMPLQSGSRTVLQRMRRGGSGEEFETLIGRMREAIPGLAVRTTFIVGYPGETEKEFRETLALARAVEFDHLGVFTYSHEENTAAKDEADDVPAEVKTERQERLLAAQETAARKRNKAHVGRTFEVLCEGASDESDHLLAGRLATQAPGIDGTVLINDGTAEAGAFVPVTITEAHPFMLIGRIADAA